MISTALRSLLSGPAFGFQPVSMDDTPDTLGIPDGVDGLVHEATGVLRAVSATEGKGGTRHQYLITYAWRDAPRYDGGYVYRRFGFYNVILGVRPKQRPHFQVLTCNCPCCLRHNAPSCRHALAADTLLNQFLVKSSLLANRPGQTGPCEVVRAWGAKPCFGCGAPTLYVHLRRPAEGSSCRVNDRKTVCTCCRLWKHEG